MLKTVCADLLEHVGGIASATERTLIERCAMLSLHMAAIERRTAEGGAMTEHDSRTYLSVVDSLARVLERLEMDKSPEPAKTPQQHIASRGTR